MIFEDLPELSEKWQKVLLGKKWAYTGGSSFAVFGLIPETKRHLELSPIMLAKAQKNEVHFFKCFCFLLYWPFKSIRIHIQVHVCT